MPPGTVKLQEFPGKTEGLLILFIKRAVSCCVSSILAILSYSE